MSCVVHSGGGADRWWRRLGLGERGTPVPFHWHRAYRSRAPLPRRPIHRPGSSTASTPPTLVQWFFEHAANPLERGHVLFGEGLAVGPFLVAFSAKNLRRNRNSIAYSFPFRPLLTSLIFAALFSGDRHRGGSMRQADDNAHGLAHLERSLSGSALRGDRARERSFDVFLFVRRARRFGQQQQRRLRGAASRPHRLSSVPPARAASGAQPSIVRAVVSMSAAPPPSAPPSSSFATTTCNASPSASFLTDVIAPRTRSSRARTSVPSSQRAARRARPAGSSSGSPAAAA